MNLFLEAQDAVSVVSGACLHLHVDCKQDNFFTKKTQLWISTPKSRLTKSALITVNVTHSARNSANTARLRYGLVYHAMCLCTPTPPPDCHRYTHSTCQQTAYAHAEQAWVLLSSPRWYTRKTVTHVGTNQARRRVTYLFRPTVPPPSCKQWFFIRKSWNRKQLKQVEYEPVR